MGKIKIEAGKLIFIMRGIEKFLAWKSKLSVPIEHVIDISTERPPISFVGRLASCLTVSYGCFLKIPKLPFGGRIRTSEGNFLVAMRNPNKCITISLKDEAYNKIILEVEDKESTAKLIREAMSSYSN